MVGRHYVIRDLGESVAGGICVSREELERNPCGWALAVICSSGKGLRHMSTEVEGCFSSHDTNKKFLGEIPCYNYTRNACCFVLNE